MFFRNKEAIYEKHTYYLNGVKKTFSVAPTKVKYYKTKKTIILIPANAIVKGLGYKFVDTDILIQESEGKLLKDIIADVGPDGFLKVEDYVS